jgi:hypothetical protein
VRAALAGDAGQKPGLGSGLLFGSFGKRKMIRLASVGGVFFFFLLRVKRAFDAIRKIGKSSVVLPTRWRLIDVCDPKFRADLRKRPSARVKPGERARRRGGGGASRLARGHERSRAREIRGVTGRG